MAIKIKFGMKPSTLGNLALESGSIMQRLQDRNRNFQGGRGRAGQGIQGTRIEQPTGGGHFHGDTFVKAAHVDGDVPGGQSAQSDMQDLQMERAQLTNDALRIRNDSNLNDLEKQQAMDQLEQQGRAFKNEPTLAEEQAQLQRDFETNSLVDENGTRWTRQANGEFKPHERKQEGGTDTKAINEAMTAATQWLGENQNTFTQDEVENLALDMMEGAQRIANRLGGGSQEQEPQAPQGLTQGAINDPRGSIEFINEQFQERATGAPLDSILTADNETTRIQGKRKSLKKSQARKAAPNKVFPSSHPTVGNSNVKMGTFGGDGKIFVLPTMVDGKDLTKKEAEDTAKGFGLDKYPSFDTEGEAQKFIDETHGKINEDGTLKETKGLVATRDEEQELAGILFIMKEDGATREEMVKRAKEFEQEVIERRKQGEKKSKGPHSFHNPDRN